MEERFLLGRLMRNAVFYFVFFLNGVWIPEGRF